VLEKDINEKKDLIHTLRQSCHDAQSAEGSIALLEQRRLDLNTKIEEVGVF
jgi:hypothetical protein